MRLKNKVVGSLIFVHVILSGCFSPNKRMSKEIEAMRKEIITLPLTLMQRYVGHKLTVQDGENMPYKLVIYTDSVECSSCALNSMYEWTDILDSLQNHYPFAQAVFIFCPQTDKRKQFKVKMLHRNFIYPIYLDTCNAFLRTNPHIPSNPLLHSFLLDEKDSVILVGNPVRNKKIEELFFKILEERKDKQDKK